jgi:hypothetical protein
MAKFSSAAVASRGRGKLSAAQLEQLDALANWLEHASRVELLCHSNGHWWPDPSDCEKRAGEGGARIYVQLCQRRHRGEGCDTLRYRAIGPDGRVDGPWRKMSSCDYSKTYRIADLGHPLSAGDLARIRNAVG